MLARDGHSVRVLAPTLNLAAPGRQTLTHSGISVTRFGAHKRVDDTLVDWFELIIEEHQRDPFDVLHGYFLPQAGFVATYAGKYLDIPSVVSIRGNDIERAAFDPSRFSHVMYALQNAGAVTTNAGELAGKAKAFINREVVVIPNGIDTDRFKPLPKNEELANTLGLGSLPVAGFAGELREKKGLRTLLSGYAQINEKRPTALLIVGIIRAGEDKQVFDEFLSTRPNAKIVVTGYVAHENLPSYYSLMDVFVHPSLRDGMPNAVLEAMACGRPVVATPVGGVPDVIQNNENGMIIPINDADALAQAVGTFFTDHELRKKLGRSARQTIIDQFTPKQELDANLNVYRGLGIPV